MTSKSKASPGRAKQTDHSTKKAPAESATAKRRLKGASPADMQEQLRAAFASEIEEINAEHAVLECEGGKCVVMSTTRDAIGEGLERDCVQLSSFADFRNRYMHRSVKISEDDKGNAKYAPLGTYWLKHQSRRQYMALTFEPGGPPEVTRGGKLYLNLWKGFGVEPTKGDWKLIKAHIRNVLADGDEASFDYIIRWLAWAVQHPDRQAEVALVFKGLKGCGKGLLGRLLVRIFGQHGLPISGRGQFTGKFNKHLRDCCFLFADEALAKGDVEGEAKLKTLITESMLMIEGKGKDAVPAPNRLHIMMASNNDWVVPATAEERRYGVFNCSNKYAGEAKGRKAYFTPLYLEIENGGAEAMLHDLLEIDLGDFHPRWDIPQTEALREQKLASLDPKEEWLLGLLEEGRLVGASARAPNIAECGALYKAARETTPPLKSESDTKLGRFLSKWDVIKDKARSGQAARNFRNLLEMRMAWEAKFGPHEWIDKDQDWRC